MRNFIGTVKFVMFERRAVITLGLSKRKDRNGRHEVGIL